MTEQQISLLEMVNGDTAIVLSLKSHRHATEKLHQLGIRVGVEIQLLRRAPLGGPLLVKVSGREIALGYELCSKILVGV
jgi:Fe2+ transport system protein FeoA